LKARKEEVRIKLFNPGERKKIAREIGKEFKRGGEGRKEERRVYERGGREVTSENGGMERKLKGEGREKRGKDTGGKEEKRKRK
jgi:hypothetical protein